MNCPRCGGIFDGLECPCIAVYDLSQQFEELARQLVRRFSYVTEDCSPFEREQRRVDAAVAEHLVRLLRMFLVQATSKNKYELQGVEDEIVRVLEAVRVLRAAAYLQLAHPSRQKPWNECQIQRGGSDSSSITHAGTGYSRWMGGGGHSDGGCRMPLETEQERRLGMCRTCQFRYGLTLVPLEWRGDTMEPLEQIAVRQAEEKRRG